MLSWEIPEPSMVAVARMDDGTPITLRRHGNPAGTRLVISNGNGLAVDLYYPYWSLLADRFDLVVHDLRSHGQNPVASLRTHNIPTLIRDSWQVSAAIEEHFGEKPTVGVYHSLATVSALVHAPIDYRFDAVVLFDPPFCPPGGTAADLHDRWKPAARRARRRQAHFESREQFTEALDRSRLFSLIPPPTRALFAETTLRPAANGGYELCCPPEHEAQILDFAFGWAMQAPAFLERLDCPAKAIGSDPTVLHSYMPSLDLRDLVKLDYDFIPDVTHFLQLEVPETCAALTIEFLEKRGLA